MFNTESSSHFGLAPKRELDTSFSCRDRVVGLAQCNICIIVIYTVRRFLKKAACKQLRLYVKPLSRGWNIFKSCIVSKNAPGRTRGSDSWEIYKAWRLHAWARFWPLHWQIISGYQPSLLLRICNNRSQSLVFLWSSSLLQVGPSSLFLQVLFVLVALVIPILWAKGPSRSIQGV
jgi:hypothetical protein